MESLKKEIVPIILIVLISIGLALVVPFSNHDFYLIGLLTSSCLWVVWVVSWDLLAGYTGMLCFGQMLFAGVAAYTLALIELNLNKDELAQFVESLGHVKQLVKKVDELL